MDSWIRSPQSRALLAAALVMSLVLAAAFVVVDRAGRAHPPRHAPLTDAQAAAQVVASAKQIVAAAHLDDTSGGYTFVSCSDETDPPYQAVFHLNFGVPQTNWVRYLREVATAMVADGWHLAPVPAEHFGHKLTREGITAVFHRNVEDPRFATMRLYGECRNITDHRADNPAWTDISLER